MEYLFFGMCWYVFWSLISVYILIKSLYILNKMSNLRGFITLYNLHLLSSGEKCKYMIYTSDCFESYTKLLLNPFAWTYKSFFKNKSDWKKINDFWAINS